MTQPHIHRDIGYTENLLPEAVGPSNMAKAFVEQALASAKGAEDAPDPPELFARAKESITYVEVLQHPPMNAHTACVIRLSDQGAVALMSHENRESHIWRITPAKVASDNTPYTPCDSLDPLWQVISGHLNSQNWIAQFLDILPDLAVTTGG